MAPPLQALISILHLLLLLLLAASMLLESLALRPPSGGYSFNLKHAGQNEKLHHITLQIDGSSVSGIADTGSDLIWLPAGENGMCSSDPIKCPCESLMRNMKCCDGHCMFERKYGEGSFARGFMVKRKLGDDKTHQDLSIGCAVDFGCPEANRKDCRLYEDGGIIGLGKGSMSLLSQLKLKEKKFSFCLPEGTELTSKIKFGDQAGQLIKEDEKVVKLVVDEEHPSKYYVCLTKISMGGTDIVDLTSKSMGDRDTCSIIIGGEIMLIDSGSTFSNKLPEEAAFQEVKHGGLMLIDSGSTFSKLPEEAFQEVKQRLEKVLGRSHEENGMACFDISVLPQRMPVMVLHFDTVEMQLPKERYMIRDGDSGPFCIAINKIKKGRPTLGNFQMRDMAMLFDLSKDPGTLAFWKDNNCKM